MTDDDQDRDRDAEQGTRPAPSPTPPPPDVSLFDHVTNEPLEPIDLTGARASRPDMSVVEESAPDESDGDAEETPPEEGPEIEPVLNRAGPREAVLLPDAQAARRARARITLKIPDDDIPQSSPQPPPVAGADNDTTVLSPATVVQAMRIIAIGDASVPPPEAHARADDEQVEEIDPEGVPSSEDIEPLNVDDVQSAWTPHDEREVVERAASAPDAEELQPEDVEQGQPAAPRDSDAEEIEPETDDAAAQLPPPVVASETSPIPLGTTPLPSGVVPSPSASAPPPPTKAATAAGMANLTQAAPLRVGVAPVDGDAAVELSDDELAPASTELGSDAVAADESPSSRAVEGPVPPGEVEIRAAGEAEPEPAKAKRPAAEEALAPPPPPPARPAQAPEAKAPPPRAVEEAPKRRRRVRAGWEEVFNDDFVRAYTRLTRKEVAAEVTFIEESLGVQRGGVVLDLGCGMGQHAVDLAARGYNVVGYDLSLTMLALAADEAQERGQKINFLQGDMREMAFEEMFDGVFSWATSFGFFDEEKNLGVLKRVHRALRKGGLFLLDLVNRDYVCHRLPSLAWFEGDGCVCIDDSQFDAITSRVRVKRTIMLEDGASREVEYSVRLYSLHEIGKMLHEVGFKVIEVSGHPATAGAFFDAESPRVITLAERR